MKKLIILAFCALFAIHSAEARTLYVNASRPNNKGNGLKLKTAKKTIQAAVNIAKKGDTILVYPGTYSPIKEGGSQTFSESSKYYNCILWENYFVEPNAVETVRGYSYYDADGRYIGYRDAGEAEIWFHYDNGGGEEYTYVESEAELSRYFPGFAKIADIHTEYVPGTKKVLHNADKGNTYKNTDRRNADPKFTSAYKLKKGSYAIDSGKLTAAQKKLVGSKDLAGRKRIRGKAIDRGCYEY